MANNLIPEELNVLIQQYLTDGVLTDKERQVILNKAEKMGLDRDEIDLFLDAEIQKIDQQTDAAARKQKGKTCPFCGGSIPLLTDKCPHCGENITPEASNELQEIFDNLEEALVDLKSGKDLDRSKATVERHSRKAKMYYGNNPRVQKLLDEIKEETEKAKKKAEKRAYVETYKQHAVLYSSILVVLLGLIGYGIYRGITAMTAEPDVTDPVVCQKAITDAIKDGNLDKAYQYLDVYLKANLVSEETSLDDIEKNQNAVKNIQSAMYELGMAMTKSGDVSKALLIHQVFDNYLSLSEFKQEELLKNSIIAKYIELDDYNGAETAGDFSSFDYKEYYDFLCKCIDKMKEKGEVDKAKTFILKKCSFFSNVSEYSYDEWNQDKVKQDLLDYLNL